MSRQSTQLYYDGYDPNWIIGTDKPAPVHPPHTTGTNRPLAAVAAKVPIQANGVVPQAQVIHAHPHQQQGPGASMQMPRAQAHEHNIAKSNLGPMIQPHVHFGEAGKPKSAALPHHGGVVGSNPNPYVQPAVVHAPRPAVHSPHGSAPVPVIRGQRPIVNAPHAAPVVVAPVVPAAAVRAKGSGPAAASPPGLPVQPIIKVVMWVPLCCEACKNRWKDELTDIPGFQGYDVEKELDRVSVFGHVDPATVLATMKKVVPRTQMWRH